MCFSTSIRRFSVLYPISVSPFLSARVSLGVSLRSPCPSLSRDRSRCIRIWSCYAVPLSLLVVRSTSAQTARAARFSPILMYFWMWRRGNGSMTPFSFPELWDVYIYMHLAWGMGRRGKLWLIVVVRRTSTRRHDGDSSNESSIAFGFFLLYGAWEAVLRDQLARRVCVLKSAVEIADVPAVLSSLNLSHIFVYVILRWVIIIYTNRGITWYKWINSLNCFSMV